MRSIAVSAVALPILFSAVSSAISIDCDHIRVDGKKYDFSSISGPHSVMVSDTKHPPAISNTTYTVDLCRPLRKIKGIPNQDQCENGANVCGVTVSYNPYDDTKPEIEHVIPIAGSFETSSGRALDPKFSRLKTSDINSDGVRVELHGGKYGGKTQMAVIEFQCDPKRTGNEGSEDPDDKTVERREITTAVDKKDEEDREEEEEKSSLRFVSYGASNENTDVLRLNWLTKVACEEGGEDDGSGNDKDSNGGGSRHWGFFTWFILLLFLGVAAYLIFGSWLNYNRYGARGWDLLPHGDTIRDVPYLFKDWSKKVVGTVSSGGTRGGYSAV